MIIGVILSDFLATRANDAIGMNGQGTSKAWSWIDLSIEANSLLEVRQM